MSGLHMTSPASPKGAKMRVAAAKAEARRQEAEAKKVEMQKKAEELEALSRKSMGYIYYGDEDNVEIDLGPNMWYRVVSDGKGAAKLRCGPEFTSNEVFSLYHHHHAILPS